MAQLTLDSFRDDDADRLIDSIPDHLSPIFQGNGRTVQENRGVVRYLFSRKPKKLPPSLKNRLIGLYDPLADRQNRFRDGLRWCTNVYVGCEHNCGYCYVNGYSQDTVGSIAHIKKDYQKALDRDLRDMAAHGVPKASIHMSNSTDPLQAELENEFGHTLMTLRGIQKNRELFSHVVILTKNPALLCNSSYLEMISEPGFQPFTVQATCAYWQEEARVFFEQKAPSVQQRLDAIKKLVAAGVNVELRIDPLFPSIRLARSTRLHREMAYYGLPEAQNEEDMVSLVKFAAESGVSSIVAKPLRVPISNKARTCKGWFGQLFLDATGTGKRYTKGRSWRLPENYQKELLHSLRNICSQYGMPLKHCMQDVLTRK